MKILGLSQSVECSSLYSIMMVSFKFFLLSNAFLQSVTGNKSNSFDKMGHESHHFNYLEGQAAFRVVVKLLMWLKLALETI